MTYTIVKLVDQLKSFVGNWGTPVTVLVNGKPATLDSIEMTDRRESLMLKVTTPQPIIRTFDQEPDPYAGKPVAPTGWLSRAHDDHTYSYKFVLGNDGNLHFARMHGIRLQTEAEWEAEGWVVKWDKLPPAQLVAPEPDLLELSEVEYNIAAQAFFEATSGSDIRYANRLPNSTIVEGLKAALRTVVR